MKLIFQVILEMLLNKKLKWINFKSNSYLRRPLKSLSVKKGRNSFRKHLILLGLTFFSYLRVSSCISCVIKNSRRMEKLTYSLQEIFWTKCLECLSEIPICILILLSSLLSLQISEHWKMSGDFHIVFVLHFFLQFYKGKTLCESKPQLRFWFRNDNCYKFSYLMIWQKAFYHLTSLFSFKLGNLHNY